MEREIVCLRKWEEVLEERWKEEEGEEKIGRGRGALASNVR